MTEPQSTQSAMTVAQALYFAHEKHGDQVDPDGRQHFDHVLRVVEMVPDELAIVAWLHDVVEDTDVTLDDLGILGVSDVELAAIDMLTKRPHEEYASYITRIVMGVGEAGVVARRVKEADLIDNLGRCLRAGDTFASLASRYRASLPRVQMGMVGR